MKPIEIEIQLDCPLEYAWATFTHVESMSQWVQGFDSLRLLEGEPESYFMADGDGPIMRSRNTFFATSFFIGRMMPLMRGVIEKRITADFGRLKALAELTAPRS
jgi:hypothetical protein